MTSWHFDFVSLMLLMISTAKIWKVSWGRVRRSSMLRTPHLDAVREDVDLGSDVAKELGAFRPTLPSSSSDAFELTPSDHSRSPSWLHQRQRTACSILGVHFNTTQKLFLLAPGLTCFFGKSCLSFRGLSRSCHK